MEEKIISMKQFKSGATAIALETKTGLAIEVGSGCIFFETEDLFCLIRLLKEADRHFLQKEE